VRLEARGRDHRKSLTPTWRRLRLAHLRSLRGTAFSGLLARGALGDACGIEGKRIKRSDGCAPLASHDLTLSMSSFSRASLSLGSSGLKWPSRSMKRPSRGKRESATTT